MSALLVGGLFILLFFVIVYLLKMGLSILDALTIIIFFIVFFIYFFTDFLRETGV